MSRIYDEGAGAASTSSAWQPPFRGTTQPGEPGDKWSARANEGGPVAWARNHPYKAATLLLLLVGIIVTVIVVPICSVKGCPPKAKEPQDDLLKFGAPRLLVSFTDELIDALDLIPAVLHQYIEKVLLLSSNIQVLDFVDEDVLQEARKYITGEQSLDFLIRDFNMSSFGPNTTEALFGSGMQDAINGVLASLGRRRKLAATSAARLVNDPFFVNGTQYYLNNMNASGAWAYTRGSPEIVIAVLDTGFDIAHPDLAPSLWTNAKEIPGNGIDDDGNGYIDDVNGYSFAGACAVLDNLTGSCKCGGTPDPNSNSNQQSYFHGTHVSGLIAAAQNNSLGITGIAPAVKLMVLRVSNCMGDIQTSSVFAALDYAVRNGAHIVSASIGQDYPYGFFPLSPAPSYHKSWADAYKKAVQPLANKGVLLVAAAGNENIDLDNLVAKGWTYSPCLTLLPNVLCVGATDALDGKAFFSNFGAGSVAIGAPGMQIYSTFYTNTSGVIQHTYAPLNGTSQATPLTAGTAALVVSLLGAADGNYYRAVDVRALLLASSRLPTAGRLPWDSGSVVSAGGAVGETVKLLSRDLKPLSPLYDDSASPPVAMSFQGLVETYYAATGSQYSASLDPNAVPVDQASRQIAFPQRPPVLTAFKYSSGVLATYTALARLAGGIWGVQVESVTGDLAFVFVNGQEVPLDTVTRKGVFTTTAQGWFLLEVRIPSTGVNTRYTLMTKGPNDDEFVQPYNLWGSPAASFLFPDRAPYVQLSSVWLANYAIIDNATVSPATLGAQTNRAGYPLSAVVANPSASLAATLFPGPSPQPAAAAGFLTAFLMPRAAALRVQAFKISCNGCQLMIDGVVIIDAYQPLITGVGVSGFSPCIDLGTGTHQMEMRFALKPPSASSNLALSMGACSTAPTGYLLPTPTNFRALSSEQLYNPLVWDPKGCADTIGTAAYIGGLQCDVYSSGRQTLSFAAAQSRPLYKVRLPACSGNTETLADTCDVAWDFTLESLLPGLNASTPRGAKFGVRCWTLWNQGFPGGNITVEPADASPVAYIGSAKVFGAGSPGSAPSSTRLVDELSRRHQQLLAVDWVQVTPTSRLRVSSNGTVLRVDLVSMRLPIGGLADPTLVDRFNGSVVAHANFGTYVASVYPASTDVAALVVADLASAYAQTGAAMVQVMQPSTGLNTAYSFPGVNASRVRYAQADGFFYPLSYVTGRTSVRVADPQGQATGVVMGNVTVLNAQPFAAAAAARTRSFEMYVPSNNLLSTNVVVKTQAPSGAATFDFFTTAPSPDGVGAWDKWQWVRRADAPL
ncbi:hypothetical protein FOA52_005198 [Chlamydomonas sp. UWO 241]|nr:hypothetical protein FOA52_005198 [Chlamydomonas sp. UWO 241]